MASADPLTGHTGFIARARRSAPATVLAVRARDVLERIRAVNIGAGAIDVREGGRGHANP
jgi:hypothetical protein